MSTIVLLLLNPYLAPRAFTASARPYKQHNVLDRSWDVHARQAFAVCVVTIEPRPLCKLTWFLFDRNYCLFYTKCRRLCSLLCTNISTPTKVETTMLSITHLTQDRRRRTSIRPYCARVLILGRVLGWGWDWETENSWVCNDNCRWLCENVRLPNLLNKAWKYIFLVLW